MTASKGAMKKAREIFKVFAVSAFSGSERAYDVEKFNGLMDEAAKRAALAIDAEREKALEEAAKVADCTIVPCKPNTCIKVANTRAIWIRDTIRTLSGSEAQVLDFEISGDNKGYVQINFICGCVGHYKRESTSFSKCRENCLGAIEKLWDGSHEQEGEHE